MLGPAFCSGEGRLSGSPPRRSPSRGDAVGLTAGGVCAANKKESLRGPQKSLLVAAGGKAVYAAGNFASRVSPVLRRLTLENKGALVFGASDGRWAAWRRCVV